MKEEYQVLARRYRPQRFCDVVGQEAIVTTLKNAIKQRRVAHAYLFCGPRGTGKTTLARLFAKALNCTQLSDDLEPCNHCAACKEVVSGASLDVMEIDGASNRGIEEIRQLKETVAYTSSTGKYRIYIIDEVHMLTKEAFNALLKTLEEPPPQVKFFFATTEPHKVLPTILSRCQRFDLRRIPDQQVIDKLRSIAKDLAIEIEEEALRLITARAGGGLRDAESLLDQLLAFHGGAITAQVVSTILGMMPQETFFALDRAGKEGNLAIAFEIAHQLFCEGKDLSHFLDALIDHFRNLLLCKLTASEALLSLTAEEKVRYDTSAKLYSQEQCLTILDFLIESQAEIKLMSSPRVALEAILLKILRSHKRVPVEFLVRRLAELEQTIAGGAPTPQPAAKAEALPLPTPPPIPLPPPPMPLPAPLLPPPTVMATISEDPTPSPADLGKRAAPINKTELLKQRSRHDTLMQFAAVELEGKLEKG